MTSSRCAVLPNAGGAGTAVASIASANDSAMGAHIIHSLALGLRQTLQRFEHPGRALAAADAHRDDREATAAPAQLVQRGRRQLRTGATERMAERDRTAVDVDAIVGDAELALAVHRLRRERFVELEQLDVFDGEVMLREQLLD